MSNFRSTPFQLAPGSLTYTIASCYRDPKSGDFVIIPDTDVIVQNADGTLTEHLTKELHIFEGTSSSSSASATMDEYYWQFATDHEKWPYMFVMKSLFETEKPPMAGPFGEETLTGKTTTAIILDEFGNLPKPALTKRQITRMHKKNICPDCKQQGMCWSVGPTINGEQKYKCANCHAMFNMTLRTKSTERM